eukprot:gb/GECG01016689.1/.p1 GENE.gb/GECG01016689.1/~~gb/GECG01016689.1/.p1  ORF type:complete len:172 (+),score=16.80 gb/GECG01016689.1/:1-516(+)
MSNTLKPYLDAVRSTLEAAMCLRNFASQAVERHNKPEIEMPSSKTVLLNPLTVARNEKEKVLIEPSINSVRINIKIKQSDHMERIIARRFASFMMQRAEKFAVMRRKPIQGYDISFLIIHEHLEKMWKHKLIDFVISFMEEVDKELSSIKISVNARCRTVAHSFMQALAPK